MSTENTLKQKVKLPVMPPPPLLTKRPDTVPAISGQNIVTIINAEPDENVDTQPSVTLIENSNELNTNTGVLNKKVEQGAGSTDAPEELLNNGGVSITAIATEKPHENLIVLPENSRTEAPVASTSELVEPDNKNKSNKPVGKKNTGSHSVIKLGTGEVEESANGKESKDNKQEQVFLNIKNVSDKNQDVLKNENVNEIILENEKPEGEIVTKSDNKPNEAEGPSGYLASAGGTQVTEQVPAINSVPGKGNATKYLPNNNRDVRYPSASMRLRKKLFGNGKPSIRSLWVIIFLILISLFAFSKFTTSSQPQVASISGTSQDLPQPEERKLLNAGSNNNLSSDSPQQSENFSGSEKKMEKDNNSVANKNNSNNTDNKQANVKPNGSTPKKNGANSETKDQLPAIRMGDIPAGDNQTSRVRVNGQNTVVGENFQDKDQRSFAVKLRAAERDNNGSLLSLEEKKAEDDKENRDKKLQALVHGLRVPMELVEPFRSGLATIVRARVIADVRDATGKVVIPESSTAQIPFSPFEVQGKVFNENAGCIVTLPDGTKISINGTVKGTDGYAGITGKVKKVDNKSRLSRMGNTLKRLPATIVGSQVNGIGGYEIGESINAGLGANTVVYAPSDRIVEVGVGTRFFFNIAEGSRK